MTRQVVTPFFLILGLLIGCSDLGPEPHWTRSLPSIGSLELIGFEDKYALKLALDDPYLYVCAGRDGLWRRNLQEMTQWEYLGLADTSLGRFANVGVLDVAVCGSEDIVVASNTAVPTVNPDSSVAVWRTSDFGKTWLRSDLGIPESRVYPQEYNAVNCLQQAPNNPDLVLAAYGPAIYRSTDRGKSWTFFGSKGVFVKKDRIRWNPFRSSDAWLFGETSVYGGYLQKSTNSGLSFDASVDFTPLKFPSDYSVTDVAFDVADDMRIFVATSVGIVTSSDNGGSWQVATSVIPGNGYARYIIEDPRKSRTLLIGGGQTIYYLSDGAESADVVAQIPHGTIQSLSLDQEKSMLIIGTTQGVFVLPIGT